MTERPHHNVFHYYRGPSKTAEGDVYDQQLEDNVTKALVNVLELCGPALTDSFLVRFTADSAGGATPYDFFLQRGPEEPSAPRRLLLGIAMESGLPEHDASVTEGEGRIDAGIYTSGALLVVIETKIGSGELEYAQLAQHSKRWGVAETEGWRSASWPEIYEWVNEELVRSQDAVTRFLLVQLRDLQRLVGLTPFVGFEAEDFAFFDPERPKAERRGASRSSRLASVPSGRRCGSCSTRMNS